MALMSGNRAGREGAKIKADRLVHLLENLVCKLRIVVVAMILSLATTSHSYPEGHKDQIARAARCRVVGFLPLWQTQHLAHPVRLAEKTLGHGVTRWRRRAFLDRMVRRKIDYRPASFRPYKTRLKLATATDERSKGS